MNGYECGMCDQSPCVCKVREQRKHIRSGCEAIQSMSQSSKHLHGLRRLMVRIIWPDLLHVMDDIRRYEEK